VILGLPCAENRREREAGGHEGDVLGLGVPVEVADGEEGKYVQRPDRHEDPERVESRREHHRKEEEKRERATRPAVCCDRNRDQADVENAPGREERISERRVPEDAVDGEDQNQQPAQDPCGEQADDEGAVTRAPAHARVRDAGGANRKGQPDARLDHLMLQLSLGGVDDP
jgi:hypothetical protein